jgi:hypothetical protein
MPNYVKKVFFVLYLSTHIQKVLMMCAAVLTGIIIVDGKWMPYGLLIVEKRVGKTYFFGRFS